MAAAIVAAGLAEGVADAVASRDWVKEGKS